MKVFFSSKLLEIKKEKLIKDLFSVIDCSYFSYYISSGNKVECISNYPKEWIDRYFDNEYQNIDYPLLKSRTTIIPFAWGEKNNKKDILNEQVNILKDAQDFKIYCGITAPIILKGKTGGVTISFDKLKKIKQTELIHIGSNLQMIINVLLSLKHILDTIHNNDLSLIDNLFKDIYQWIDMKTKNQKNKHFILDDIICDLYTIQILIKQHRDPNLSVSIIDNIKNSVENLKC